MRASLTAGTYVDAAGGRTKFAAYADQWRRIQVHREQTTALTERSLRLYINPVIGDLPLAAVRPAHVQQLVKLLSEELAPSTVAVAYGYMASIFKAAVRDRLIGRTRAMASGLPAVPLRRMFTPDPAGIEAVAGFLPRPYRTVPRIAARCGLRPSGEIAVEDRTEPRNPVRRGARLVFVTSHGQPVKRSTWSGVWSPAARKARFPARTGLRWSTAAPLVKMPLGDVLHDAIGHEIPDRLPQGHPGPARGG